jgi:hypothetical protein
MSTILQAMLTSWPFWIAVWLTVLLVLFRSNIRGLIDRITGQQDRHSRTQQGDADDTSRRDTDACDGR